MHPTPTASPTPIFSSTPTSALRSLPSSTTTFSSVSTSSASTPSSSTPSTTTATALATTAAASSSRPALKPAQIAGLSAAAAATFTIAIALIALSIFLRKRRERRSAGEVDEEKPTRLPPISYNRTHPGSFPPTPPSRIAPKRFPLEPVPERPQHTATTNPHPGLAARASTIRAVSPTASPPRNRRSEHYALAPSASLQGQNRTDKHVPLDKIGLAISAEPSPASVLVGHRPSATAVSRQQEMKGFRLTAEGSQRPDSFVSQNTVFEEDATASRRRSSKLLPTPPIPVPPIRALPPPRPPPVFNLNAVPSRKAPPRPQPPQNSALSLNIPSRHSRVLAEDGAHQSSPARLAPAAGLAPPHEASESASMTSDPSNGGDIPDYYFTAHRFSPKLTVARPSDRTPFEESPKLLHLRPKVSSSTISRVASKASTNNRGSISSQTSFESVDSDDPTPEEEDDAKKLSPVAESPLSTLRYPKVPRTSNQRVARSPGTPQSRHSQSSPRRLPEASALVAARRAERRSPRMEGWRGANSPRRSVACVGVDMPKAYQCHRRSSSAEMAMVEPSHWRTRRQNRVRSGQWPGSPAMYDMEAEVRPLMVRSKHFSDEQELPDMVLKTPTWVPHQSPRSRADDLFFSVAYSMPVNEHPH